MHPISCSSLRNDCGSNGLLFTSYKRLYCRLACLCGSGSSPSPKKRGKVWYLPVRISSPRQTLSRWVSPCRITCCLPQQLQHFTLPPPFIPTSLHFPHNFSIQSLSLFSSTTAWTKSTAIILHPPSSTPCFVCFFWFLRTTLPIPHRAPVVQ